LECELGCQSWPIRQRRASEEANSPRDIAVYDSILCRAGENLKRRYDENDLRPGEQGNAVTYNVQQLFAHRVITLREIIGDLSSHSFQRAGTLETNGNERVSMRNPDSNFLPNNLLQLAPKRLAEYA
jgi:hypothetical protein